MRWAGINRTLDLWKVPRLRMGQASVNCVNPPPVSPAEPRPWACTLLGQGRGATALTYP